MEDKLTPKDLYKATSEAFNGAINALSLASMELKRRPGEITTQLAAGSCDLMITSLSAMKQVYDQLLAIAENEKASSELS